MAFANLLVEKSAPLATLMVNRAAVLNALTRTTVEEMIEALEQLEADADVRVVIITGSGERSFVAGADIGEMAKMSTEEALAFAGCGHRLMDTIARMSKIVIAAVNGFALGGGCELALACDFIFASEKAKFGQPEVKLGIIPGFGGTQRLARRVGSGHALELIAVGDPITAAEAHRLGLVNAVLAADKLLEHARAVATKIAARSPIAVAAAKRAVRQADETSLEEGNRFERRTFADGFYSEDQKEGMMAFMEKREARFSGR